MRFPRSRQSLAFLFVPLLLCPTSPSRGDETTLPFRDVRAGMKGIGKTVFEGTRVDPFDVEIVGTLPNIGPGQNLILGRCSGGPLAQTGILAGMSGSPVYVDGKLIGAIAYAWGFAKEPIAGITPIDEMLAVASRGGGQPVASRTVSGLSRADWERLGSPERLDEFLNIDLPSRIAAPARGLAPSPLPVSVAGIGGAGLDRMLAGLRRVGLSPIQSGSAGASASPPPRLEPGSAVGIKLVQGDVEIAATGTLTWTEGNRLLAFGHPLFGLGPVSLPLTAARVEALLPSLDRSMRLASPLGDVGTIVQDRTAGILGELGKPPRMIPVRLQLSVKGKSGRDQSFSFDLVEDPLLAPLLLYASLNGIIESAERVSGNVTLRWKEGSVIKTEGHEDVELDNLFAGSSAPHFATATSAFLLYLLMNNDLVPPRIAGINLILEYYDEPRTARVRRVTLDRFRVRPGEEMEATLVLSPFRGPDQLLRRKIRIPAETASGPLTLQVGDALAMSRMDSGDAPPRPKELAQMIEIINRVPRNDRLYIVAVREDGGVFLGGSRLSNLPPSAQAILSRPRSRGNYSTIPQRALVEEQIPVDYEIEGFTRVQVEVEER